MSIISFRCGECAGVLLDPDLIEATATRFEKDGSDLWFDESQNETLLPSNHPCPNCQAQKWAREEHILDVWFDSGVSFAAVLEKDSQLKYPADLYLEGSDQHRGWFHSSLLCSIGTRSKPPYAMVLTHGFVVDSHGKKYSKSAGNYVPPEKVLKETGAEILRLWVAAEDYRNDIRVSNEILNRLVEAYRKIRNTCRYLLGNLYDFEPDTMPKDAALEDLDRWALYHLQKLTNRIREAYENYDFHVIFHELNRYCTVDLSAFYLDILKDRLYTSAKSGPSRRAAQRVLWEIASTLSRLMAPILSFTAEEVWEQIPSFRDKTASVHLAEFPVANTEWMDETLADRWEKLRDYRDEVLKILEGARQAKVIGNSLEARVILVATDEPERILSSFGNGLSDLLLVSEVIWGQEISPKATRSERHPTLFIEVQKAEGTKCERCWRWSREVGKFTDHPTLCERCQEVICA